MKKLKHIFNIFVNFLYKNFFTFLSISKFWETPCIWQVMTQIKKSILNVQKFKIGSGLFPGKLAADWVIWKDQRPFQVPKLPKCSWGSWGNCEPPAGPGQRPGGCYGAKFPKKFSFLGHERSPETLKRGYFTINKRSSEG